MEYRRLGLSGMKVSEICCGTHDFRDETTCRQMVQRSFEEGINFFDTSCSYGEKGEVEILTGKLLSELPRDELVIATKVKFGYGAQGPNARGLSRKHIRHSVEISLQRLNIDFIDLYQLHGYVPDCPLEETVCMMGDLIHQGKILYWGISNFNPGWTAELLHAVEKCGVPYPVSHQPQYSLIQPGLVDTQGKDIGLDRMSETYGFGILPYSPLARGVLTDKYAKLLAEGGGTSEEALGGRKRKPLSENGVRFVLALKEIADSLSCTLSQLALAWLLTRPFVNSVLNGYSNMHQFEDNLQGASLRLDTETVEKIDALRREHRAGV